MGAELIATLLPGDVVTVELFGDAEDADAFLFPGEAAAIAGAVDGRRREFTSVRVCARRALARLGREPAPLVPGKDGAPTWPAGIVGSMTHCAGYRAAALAETAYVASVGIDAEPHLPLPDGVAEIVALPAERRELAALRQAAPRIAWDRVLFSAKESVYKAWYPLTGAWLDFEDASVSLRPEGTFTARLLVPGPVASFEGRWALGDAHLATAIAHRPPRPPVTGS